MSERAALLSDFRGLLAAVSVASGATSVSGPAVVRPAGYEEIDYRLPGRQGQILIDSSETSAGRLRIHVVVTEETNGSGLAVRASPVSSPATGK